MRPSRRAAICRRQSLVLFRDRMVTNCLLFGLPRRSAGKSARRDKYSTKLRRKNQAPILPLTNGGKAGNIVPSFEYFALIRTSRRRCARRDPAVGVSREQDAPSNIPLEHPPERNFPTKRGRDFPLQKKSVRPKYSGGNSGGTAVFRPEHSSGRFYFSRTPIQNCKKHDFTWRHRTRWNTNRL